MRGYYAILNDTPYELPKLSLTQASQIVGEEQDSITCSPILQDKSLAINIHKGSELSKKTQTNKELADTFKQFLKEVQTTEITKLSDHFVLYAEYTLRDNMSATMVDHGAFIKDVSPKSFIFPLGITSEDEYVARLGMEISTTAEQRYATRHPYGINDPYRRESYTFTIQRIWITAIKEEAWSVKPLHRPYSRGSKFDYQAPITVYGSDADRAWGLPYGMRTVNTCDPAVGIRPLHPSVAAVSYIPQDVSVSPSDVIVIYDTAALIDGAVYSANISYAPVKVTLGFSIMSLLPILVSSDEISDILNGNQEEIDNATSSTPTIPSDDKTTSDVINGDDNDVTPPETDVDDEKTSTEEPSTSDSELAGDDKDVTPSTPSETVTPSTDGEEEEKTPEASVDNKEETSNETEQPEVSNENKEDAGTTTDETTDPVQENPESTTTPSDNSDNEQQQETGEPSESSDEDSEPKTEETSENNAEQPSDVEETQNNTEEPSTDDEEPNSDSDTDSAPKSETEPSEEVTE
jgi:hypothetical protein